MHLSVSSKRGVLGTAECPAWVQVDLAGDFHGMDGLSKLPEAPFIAAQPAAYLVAQILTFRAGQRHNDVMTLAVRDLTDRQIADRAAYHVAIEIAVARIPGCD
jgi:cytochrome c553